jgi:CxxC-x17-CxxC domain-containing protein
MSLQDQTIVCFDCGKEFIFSVEDQEDYLSRGRRHAPKRCYNCREKRKERKINNSAFDHNRSGLQNQRKMYTITCSECGKEAQVPFEPIEDRPVYCRDCYGKIKAAK